MQSEKTLQWAVSQNNESVVVTLIGELTRNTSLPRQAVTNRFIGI